MTLSITSDVHAGRVVPYFTEHPDKLIPADVLIIAGDVATFKNKDDTLKSLREATEGIYKDIIYINGNHDYYTSEAYMIELYKTDFDGPSVNHNKVISLSEKTKDGADRTVDFICSTLWSPIKNHNLIRNSLNDYNYIPYFSTERCTELFYENLGWLEEKVKESTDKGNDIVIVTHHVPRHELISKIHKSSSINEAFAVIDTEAEKRIAALKPMLWIHGHSHTKEDKVLDGVRYIRNPHGYTWTGESTLFRELVIEI